MKRILALIFTLSWVVGGTGLLAQSSRQLTSPVRNVALSADAAVFVMKATEGSMKEVEAGKLAASKASAADVKAFARRMVEDHTKAGQELAAIAKAKAISAPGNPAGLKTALEPLQALTGAAFDRAYMDKMVTDHEATIALFESQVAAGTDAEVKAWAAKTLPTVREHLAMAKKAQSALAASQQP